HRFRPRQPSDSRSPCPALNTLANHSFIPHSGKALTFSQLVKALVLVYNISYTLAFLLASAAFLTCGKLSFDSYHGPLSMRRRRSSQDNEVRRSRITDLSLHLISCARSLATRIFRHPSWTLDLQSLSQRGYFMIAHDGSFVHPDGIPSTSPDPSRVDRLLRRASTARDSQGDFKGGLDFKDIVHIHAENVRAARPMLSVYHKQISLGECSLLWEILRERSDPRGEPLIEVIPTCRLQQWLGDEQLPDGWWEIRPRKTVGLLQARKTANEIARL
ncbi:hypothetical protein BYT27DRAFT_7007632, partial [Phlegmacium glaucopus]